jgi:hypothetical protein
VTTTVTAREGDTLCGIAVDAGFANCNPLREEAANADFLDRPLRVGERVTVPEVERGEEDGAADARHRFIVRGASARVRFVHGSPDRAARDDDSLSVLHISNFVTTRAGIPEVQAFPPHTTSAFNAHAHADVDAFKLEVFDPHAGAATVDVEMLALEPVLAPDGAIREHREFAGAERARRALTVTCRRVASDPERFRSCYLRLVTDDEDKAARARQTLLVTDSADGAAGDADRLEILDQNVRATYVLRSCRPARGTHSCRSIAELPVGEDRLRFRTRVHVLRTARGAAGSLAEGITIPEVRRHMFRWVRRTYSQADMSLIVLGIDEVDPLENLISIFNPGHRTAAGGGRLSVRVNTDPAPTEIEHATTRDEAPLAQATAIAAQIAALPGFAASAFPNPQALNNAQSADVIVTRSDGGAVVLDRARSTDARARIEIGRVAPNVSTTPAFNFMNVGARDHRVLIRNFASDATCVHVFVIRRFRASDGAVGYAYTRDHRQLAKFQAAFPVLGCCFVEARTLARADRRVHTTDHEIGHILCDMFHFAGRHPELMTDEAVDLVNSVGASKRLSHRSLPHQAIIGRDAGGTFNRSAPVNPVDDARRLENPAFIEAWPRRRSP